jgi:small subunit ribosomal protein S16
VGYGLTKTFIKMAVKIRLQRKGKKKKPFYHIVIADARAPRDGRFIEKIGTYNPLTKPATIDIDRDKAYDWLTKGAQPTETVAAILRFKGILFKKHLMRGVKKGALTMEQAEVKFHEWVENKEARIAARAEKAQKERFATQAAIAGLAVEGVTKVVPKVTVTEKPVEEVAETKNTEIATASTEEE